MIVIIIIITITITIIIDKYVYIPDVNQSTNATAESRLVLGGYICGNIDFSPKVCVSLCILYIFYIYILVFPFISILSLLEYEYI